MKRLAVFSGLSMVVLALAGCQTAYAPRDVEPSVQPNGIQGTWVDPNGIVSTFRNGRFETRTTDSNSVLATGSYTRTSPDEVSIRLHSLLRNTDSTVNCALVNPEQLNCTSSSGSQFSLARQNGPVRAAG